MYSLACDIPVLQSFLAYLQTTKKRFPIYNEQAFKVEIGYERLYGHDGIHYEDNPYKMIYMLQKEIATKGRKRVIDYLGSTAYQRVAVGNWPRYFEYHIIYSYKGKDEDKVWYSNSPIPFMEFLDELPIAEMDEVTVKVINPLNNRVCEKKVRFSEFENPNKNN